MMSKKKKIIIVICLAAALILAGVFIILSATRQAAISDGGVETVALSRMVLTGSIDVKGTVQGSNDAKVYSQLPAFTVQNVNVKIGDKVSEGDVLCQLNTENLEKQIEQLEASIEAAQNVSEQAIKGSQLKYDASSDNLANGHNQAVNTAKAAKEAAGYTLDQAKIKYDAAKKATLDAQTTLDEAQVGGDPDNIAAAQAAYDAAVINEATASSAASAAENAYSNAKRQYNSALTAANQQIDADKQALEASKAAADINAQQASLDILKLQFAQATIKSPISGTVIAVNAVESAASAGVLFVIADTVHLQVEVKIGEKDVNRVALGNQAAIESEATGKDVYEGKLESIEPASVDSVEALTGSAQISSDTRVNYKAIIDVTSQQTRLKIGMNTEVSIIVEQIEDVLAVPQSAVMTNEAGETVVYALVTDEQSNGSYQEIPVVSGLETDAYVEISGEGLKEGMQIVLNPAYTVIPNS
jgi:multidrug efflux pump subunit AcrA (membrane-fusion protein)